MTNVKRKTLIVLGAALLALLLGVWLWYVAARKGVVETRSGNSTTTRKASRPSSSPPATTISDAIPQPRLFKSTRYPPETPEEKALWEWWRAMEKADAKFEWKMPIEFYGKIVDQFGEPVAEATVRLTWTAVDDSHETEILSGTDGLFQFTGAHGKGLNVSVRKQGYLPTRNAGGGFEYASFSDDMFHVPEKGSPVVFRLQKLIGAESVYVFRAETMAKPNSPPVILNVEMGKFTDEGNLSFAVEFGGERTDTGPAYTIRVTGLNGTELLPTTEEFPFFAPEQGYQGSFVLQQPARRENYEATKSLKFYVKLAGGRYAFVGMEIALSSQGTEVRLSGGVRYNDKWSQNLEFDHRKWLNRQ